MFTRENAGFTKVVENFSTAKDHEFPLIALQTLGVCGAAKTLRAVESSRFSGQWRSI